MYIVSACLIGIKCRYDGGDSLSGELLQLISSGKLIPVCPEQLGGLSTPRSAAEISCGSGRDVLSGCARVTTKNGEDVTNEFVKGAEETLKISKMMGCKKAILKARSPSCGCGQIYDGSFSGRLREGNGVTAQLLIDNGIEVITRH